MATTPDRTQEIREALSRLATRGAVEWWASQQQPLLELPAVQARIRAHGESHAGEALREVLRAAVARLNTIEHQRLLTIVLALDPEYRGLNARTRREIAGRSFRNGAAPVKAGTIRQHHEPRALDELARILVTEEDAAAVPAGIRHKEPGRAVSNHASFEWHPNLHSKWAGERLYFWRLTLQHYEPQRVLERVQTVLEKAQVTSWAMYDLLGPADILLRCWLPGSQRDFEMLLIEAFADDTSLAIECFEATDVLLHWPWVDAGARTMREPSSEQMNRPLPPSEIKDASSGLEPLRSHLSQQHLFTEFSLPDAGLGFVTVFEPAPHPLTAESSATFRKHIARLITAEDRFENVSLYRGIGFGEYLVQGHIAPRDAARLDRVFYPLRELASLTGRRLTTAIVSSPRPRLYHESLPTITAMPESHPSARDLLVEGEGMHVAVKASAFLDRRSGSKSSRRSSAYLLKAITGMLNTGGGAIVIGALDLHSSRSETPASNTPTIGGFAVCGIDAEIGAGWDAFERRLRDACASIVPDPNALIRLAREQIAERTICLLSVRATPLGESWFYYAPAREAPRFFVRAGGTTQELVGPEADAYKRRHAAVRGTTREIPPRELAELPRPAELLFR